MSDVFQGEKCQATYNKKGVRIFSQNEGIPITISMRDFSDLVGNMIISEIKQKERGEIR